MGSLNVNADFQTQSSKPERASDGLVPARRGWTPWLASLFLMLPSPSWTDSPTLAGSIPVPQGYHRKTLEDGSYGRYLQTLPIKKDKRIAAFNGESIRGFNVFAVLDMPILFHQDLEQCADYAMRLWAEYHKRSNILDRLYLFDYNGNRKPFSASGKSYSSFLKWSFTNTNSYSLKRGCKPVASEAELLPGDMLIQNENGGIGHVSVVMDICEASGAPRLYLIGFSYMPAQEFHIERASDNMGKGGWFTFEGYKRFLTEILPYGPPVLRRFSR